MSMETQETPSRDALDQKLNRIFAGKVVALGTKHRIPTPVNETILRIVHVLEQQSGARP